MEPKRLYKSQTNKIIAGVCGGLAKYIGMDATVFRIIFILATLLTLGIFASLYLILVAFIPYEEGQKFE